MLKMGKPLLDLIYPVGSIYMSLKSSNPGVLFGGTWQQIKGRFLLGTGIPDDNANTWWGTDLTYNGTDKYSQYAGETGGSSRHTLTIDETPSHNHPTTMKFNGGGGTAEYSVMWNHGDWQGPYDSGLGAISIGNTGGDQAHNNMPPYLAVYMWQRTA